MMRTGTVRALVDFLYGADPVGTIGIGVFSSMCIGPEAAGTSDGMTVLFSFIEPVTVQEGYQTVLVKALRRR